MGSGAVWGLVAMLSRAARALCPGAQAVEGLRSSPEADAEGSNCRPLVNLTPRRKSPPSPRHGELQSRMWSVAPLPTVIVGLPWAPGRQVHTSRQEQLPGSQLQF